MSRRSCSVLGYPARPVRNGQTAPLFASCQCSGTVSSISAHSTQSADSSFRRSGLAARFTLYCTQPFIKRHCKLQIPKIRRKAKSLLGFPAFPHLYHTLYKQVKNHDPIYFSLSIRCRFVGRTARTEKQKKMQRDAKAAAAPPGIHCVMDCLYYTINPVYLQYQIPILFR